MCGIAGFITAEAWSADAMVDTVSAMADTLHHRGPDDSGTMIDRTNHVALGHRRLAIIDLSPAGAQPMTSSSGRWTVAFNGEIYNHRDLRAVLEAAGRRFRGHSDTETIVEAIDEWGVEEALSRSSGMFAIAAFDSVDRRVVLGRDRLGEKPLYWTKQGDRFAFASELRALRMVPGFVFRVDPSAATALLRWSYIPHPHTIYTDVQQLAPGSLLEIESEHDDLTLRASQWWSLGDTIDRARDQRGDNTLVEAADELDELLGASVSGRLESDVALGVFLSGGIDSSLIAHYAQRANGAVTTFTVSMSEIGFDESVHAARVATHLGTDHRVVDLKIGDALDMIPHLPAIWDEPFGDPSMLPSALLCRAASRELKVCLGGDGGDELFAGYNRHALGATVQRLAGRVPRPVRNAAARVMLVPSPASIDRAMTAVSRVLPGDRRLPNMGDKSQKLASLIISEESAWSNLAGTWPIGDLGVIPYGPLVPELSAPLDGVEQLMLTDTASVLPDQMLVKVDRASMASSLEVRAPFLDHRLIEWSWRQPLDVKTSKGVGKLVLRELASRVLPDDVSRRPKMGFDPPLGTWLRTDLRSWADDLLRNCASAEAGWIDGAAVQRVWREHLEGTRNWEYQIWGILMLESWLAMHPH